MKDRRKTDTRVGKLFTRQWNTGRCQIDLENDPIMIGACSVEPGCFDTVDERIENLDAVPLINRVLISDEDGLYVKLCSSGKMGVKLKGDAKYIIIFDQKSKIIINSFKHGLTFEEDDLVVIEFGDLPVLVLPNISQFKIN